MAVSAHVHTSFLFGEYSPQKNSTKCQKTKANPNAARRAGYSRGKDRDKERRTSGPTTKTMRGRANLRHKTKTTGRKYDCKKDNDNNKVTMQCNNWPRKRAVAVNKNWWQ